jgi:sulfate adenylyltransferase subunit 1 (EFTu-like GTPase family)
MPWYEGPTLLYTLENIHIASDQNHIDCRFPVQYVIRPMSNEHHDYRGFAGRVAGGVFKQGDKVTVLPSGFQSKIKSIDTFSGTIEEASARLSYACSEAMKAFRAALADSARGTNASTIGEQDSDAVERERVVLEEEAPHLKKKKSGTAEATH